MHHGPERLKHSGASYDFGISCSPLRSIVASLSIWS